MKPKRLITEETAEKIEALTAAVHHALTYSQEVGWKSVDEFLPEDGQVVIALAGDEVGQPYCNPEECMSVAVFQKLIEDEDYGDRENVFIGDQYDYADGEVTHWLPLPGFPAEIAAKLKKEETSDEAL